jgi:hypothetical protein
VDKLQKLYEKIVTYLAHEMKQEMDRNVGRQKQLRLKWTDEGEDNNIKHFDYKTFWLLHIWTI